MPHRKWKFLSPDVEAKIEFLFYRYRFLLIYTIIGFSSLILEIMIFRWLLFVHINEVVAYLLAFLCSIGFAYWLNVRLNFKVPQSKRNRAVIYFILISLCSGLGNLAFRVYFERMGWSYEQSRLVGSAILFLVAYFFHRRFSFRDYKKVGVAIYANGVENIGDIQKRIGNYPDFIHVDLIDDTFGETQLDPKTFRLEVIKAYWPGKSVHVHLMSRTPSRWLEDVLPYSDVLIIHSEIDDDPVQVLDFIRKKGKKAGLCISLDTPTEKIKFLAGSIDMLMFLSIRIPGKSGQNFELETLDRIGEVNRWEQRREFEICVDGGINEKNIGLLNVENVVSGSSVLNHPNPPRQIMRLQTTSNYEKL